MYHTEDKPMNENQIDTFIEIAQTGSFSRAAQNMHISQPAVTYRMRMLEEELGVKLFDRSYNPMTLTPAGEHFIRNAQELLYQEDQLVKSMEQFQTGESGECQK